MAYLLHDSRVWKYRIQKQLCDAYLDELETEFAERGW